MKFFYYVNELIEYHDTMQLNLNVKDVDYKFVVVSMGIQMISDEGKIGILHFGFQIIIQQI